MKKTLFVATIGISLLAASGGEDSKGSVVTEVTVDAPLSTVWKAWTTKEEIESWMVAKTEFELKLGATWKTSYLKDSTLDDDASIHHTVLSFDPERMLSFRTIKPPKSFPFPDLITKTWVVVYFEPMGDRKTKVTEKMMGFGEGEDWQKMRSAFERGNRYTLDRLAKKFSKQ